MKIRCALLAAFAFCSWGGRPPELARYAIEPQQGKLNYLVAKSIAKSALARFNN